MTTNVWIYGVFAISVLVFYIWAFSRWTRPNSMTREMCALGTMAVMIALVVAPAAILQIVYSGNMVVAANHTVIRTFTKDKIYWVWDKELKGGDLVCCWTDVASTIQGTLHPITDNPKVRDLDYEVVLVHFGTPQAWMDFQRNGTKIDVASLLYEFQEKNSKALAKFYNPRDASQQSQFGWMIRGYLEPQLANTGTRIQSVRFIMDGPHYVGESR